ncbi:hypothetical protein J4206_05780 [Candidatus Woesearchaeota archaeon]|nr:hypothetical protein [Candidatus Woesearchaeota archaeon]
MRRSLMSLISVLIFSVILLTSCNNRLVVDNKENKSFNDANFNPTPNCTQVGSRFDCYARFFQDSVKYLGPENALKLIEGLDKNDSFVHGQCHQLVHVLGRASFDYYSDAIKAYSHGTPFCWSGYYHGILEQYLKRSPEIKTAVKNICKSDEIRQTGYLHYQCVHGLGHGLMYYFDNEIFPSLEHCDLLEDDWSRTSCYGGVFMENIIADELGNKDHTAKYLKTDDTIYPCNAVDYRYKERCYIMVTSHILKVNGYNFEDAFVKCANVEPSYGNEFKEICFVSIGRDASGSTKSDPDRTLAKCAMAKILSLNATTANLTTIAEEQCIIGAAKDFVSNFAGAKEAAVMCKKLSGKLRQKCVIAMANILSTLFSDQDKKLAECKALVPDDYDDCVKGLDY